jgi:hypothetical protein
MSFNICRGTFGSLAMFTATRNASSRDSRARTRYQSDAPTPKRDKEALDFQIERLEALLLKLGTLHDAKYNKHEKIILDGLSSNDAKLFESAHRDLGEMLGFRAGKHESDASPDPWWIAGHFCLVFEDHSGANPASALGAAKARQAAGHPNWMRDHKTLVQLPDDCQILPVLVTGVSRAEEGAFSQLDDVALWPIDDFRAWARSALGIVRGLRRTLGMRLPGVQSRYPQPGLIGRITSVL